MTATQKKKALQKQFELSDSDVEYLGTCQYSDEAWEVVGRKHGVDPTTRVVIPNSHHRAFIAAPKVWPPLPPAHGGILTRDAQGHPTTLYNPGELRALAATNSDVLTQPISPDTYEEKI